jgi:hypothetical protein
MPTAEQRISKRGATFDREAVLCAHRLDVDDDASRFSRSIPSRWSTRPTQSCGACSALIQAMSRPAPIRDKAGKRARRAAPGTLLPASEYEIPILRYLEECGGRAPAREAIEAVGKALDGRLTEADRQPLKSGKIRWEERAGLVRFRLVQQGELVKNSPRAIAVVDRYTHVQDGIHAASTARSPA